MPDRDEELSRAVEAHEYTGGPAAVRFRHRCEVCDRTEVLEPDAAHRDGWDYPPKMYAFGVVSPRTCPHCSISETAWAAVALQGKSWEELTDRQRAAVERILNEPESLLP